MEAGFWFRSDLFQIQKDEDEETNPGCYGKALGNWLCRKFREQGYEVEDLIAEDWGWCVMCHRKGYLLWIACGSVMAGDLPDNEDSDVPPDGKDVVWHVYPVVEVPFFYVWSRIKIWMGQLDTNSVLKKTRNDLKAILDAEPRIDFCEEP